MPGEEGSEPTAPDPLELHLPRGATGSGSAQTSTTPVTRLVDTKRLLQVTPYHGDKASFLSWKWSFLIALRAISKPLQQGFKKIEDNMNQDFRRSRLSNEDLELADHAYALLALPCKDEACASVRPAEDGNGYQAWQALLRARTARNATNLLKQSPDPRINLRQWNINAEEYATRTGERVSEGIRKAVYIRKALYMNKLAPQDMRQHLMLNQARLNTAEDVAQEIEDYCGATEELSRDETGQARFMAPVGKGRGKQEKGGKQGRKNREQGKMHKGLGFQPQRGEQRRVGGYCNWCWRIGHKEAQCWFGQEYTKSNAPQDPLQRDIRAWTNPAEKGQGHNQPKGRGKGKEKAKDKSHEKGTTTRTRLDLRTRKLDSAG